MPEQPPTPTILHPGQMPGPAATAGAPPAKPRLKKLRLAFVLLGLAVLALVSTIFGMMMAVASDLPALENKREYRNARNSVLVAADGKTRIAKLTGNNNRILVGQKDISPNIENAVIAIEDRRFYEHGGVDYRGIGRALWADVRQQSAAQGGSTLTQQFVKNALIAQSKRTVFEKLREAALAYHLERRWSKQKIITEYLNTVYFGNGAYGVESAVRTYFGYLHGLNNPNGDDGGTQKPDVGQLLSGDVTPAQAALLAGMIASPSLYDPVDNPRNAKRRRNHVLRNMRQQKMITAEQFRQAIDTPLPTASEISPPKPDSSQPYFSTWLTQQLVSKYGSGAIFGGGLKIRTTIDPQLQQAAEGAIANHLTGVGPSASLVAIENKTGEVKAMVGGNDFQKRPFNLATNGHRQPGSAFKPFTLIASLERGVSPDAVFSSRKKIFPVPGSPKEKFVVNNYENEYSGSASLRTATATSDNSVYAELGLQTGTKRIAHLAQKMGIQTPVSHNPAMTLGGLKEGLTPLELAYAYTSIANDGQRISGSLASSDDGPVGIESVKGGARDDKNEKRVRRVFPAGIGKTAQDLLSGVITNGTGKAAAIGEFAAGKTGTTENYGDAWFVGFNKQLTVAVWVGYPNGIKQMKTEYHGDPVAGGTFPAEIWHDFMTTWIGLRDQREAAKGKKDGEDTTTEPTLPTGPSAPPSSEVPSAPQTTTPTPQQGGGDQGGQGGQNQQQAKPQAPRQPSAPQRQPTPSPAPAPTPQGGGGTGGGATPGQG